jgi:hypothetical protein
LWQKTSLERSSENRSQISFAFDERNTITQINLYYTATWLMGGGGSTGCKIRMDSVRNWCITDLMLARFGLHDQTYYSCLKLRCTRLPHHWSNNHVIAMWPSCAAILFLFMEPRVCKPRDWMFTFGPVFWPNMVDITRHLMRWRIKPRFHGTKVWVFCKVDEEIFKPNYGTHTFTNHWRLNSVSSTWMERAILHSIDKKQILSISLVINSGKNLHWSIDLIHIIRSILVLECRINGQLKFWSLLSSGHTYWNGTLENKLH